MAKKQRFRLRHMFWLDMLDSEEQSLAEYVEDLKSQRTFATTIRDGLRLMRDLRSGNIEVLCELFPMVKAKLQTPPSTDSDLKREIEMLKALLLHNTNPPTVAAPRSIAPVALAGNARTLEAPKFDLPRFDEDDSETLVLTKEINTNYAQNLLNTLAAAMQQ